MSSGAPTVSDALRADMKSIKILVLMLTCDTAQRQVAVEEPSLHQWQMGQCKVREDLRGPW